MDVRIRATGRYLPARRVTAADVDARLGLAPGTCLRISGVEERYYVDGERASDMGAAAVRDALRNAHLGLKDFDLLICGSGGQEQPIPVNSALILEKLGVSGIAAFDVGATCLGFIVGLHVAATFVAAGLHRRVVVVSSDITSVVLNDRQPEAYGLFGDGAAAAVVEATPPDPDRRRPSRILAAAFSTHTEGTHLTEIRGGGSALVALHYTAQRRDDFLFDMDGPRIFRLAVAFLPPALERLLAAAEVRFADIDFIVPHQASHSAMEIFRRRLKVDPARWACTVQKYGNTAASALPLALDDCLRAQKIRRGDRILLMGTAAGFSTGLMLLDY
jgi:3-oxoacyl-[acyl-carrier-protein] synthase III